MSVGQQHLESIRHAVSDIPGVSGVWATKEGNETVYYIGINRYSPGITLEIAVRMSIFDVEYHTCPQERIASMISTVR